MKKNWPLKSVEEISERVAMGPFGSSIKVSTFVDQGIPVISGQHLKESRLVDGKNNFITEEHAHKLEKANVFPGDVIFTHAGNIGQVAYIPDSARYKRYVISQRQFYCRPDLNQVLPHWITAYFRSPYGRHSLLSNASSTGVPSIARPVTHLRSIKIPVPPLTEQETITSILEVIEEKIQLNDQVARTLEELAQRLFKSWFVDFDPVRAKMAGHEPAHMPPEIAALFPDKLVDSPLGTIPEGWSVTCVENVAEIIKGRSYKKAEISESDTALVTLKSFHRGGGYRHDGLKPYLGRYKEAQLVRPGDLVVACTDVTQQADVIGQPALVGSTSEFDKLVVSLDVLKIKPNNSVSNEFLYFLFRQKFYRYHILAYVTGTTVLHLAKDGLPSFKFPMAPQAITEAFNSLASQIFDKIRLLHSENCCLSEIRDRLLPKLISGEIRVPEAQESAEEA